MIHDAGYWAPQEKFDKYIQESSAIPERREKVRELLLVSALGKTLADGCGHDLQSSECNTMAGDPQKGKPSGPKKLAVTGVYGNSCRHVFLMPSGVVDFHKGERYAVGTNPMRCTLTGNEWAARRYRYVDVAIACVMSFFFNLGVVDYVFAYDIACKYSINFQDRVTETFAGVDTKILPLLPSLFIQSAIVIWLIGKFHLASHREDCLKKYSFNFTRGVGRMSGELVETIWAYFDYLKYQTREMSAGARKEVLTDAMNWWNWQKLVKIGTWGGGSATRSGSNMLNSVIIKLP